MKKIVILLTTLEIVLFFSGCATYYTKLYVINDPPEYLQDWKGYDIVGQFEGMEISLSFVGPYQERDISIVKGDSFVLEICVQPSGRMQNTFDSVIIDSVIVAFSDPAQEYVMMEKERVAGNEISCSYFHKIRIPDSEKSVIVEFVLITFNGDDGPKIKSLSATLHRWEKKSGRRKYLIKPSGFQMNILIALLVLFPRRAAAQ
jgi:hypothetical protein